MLSEAMLSEAMLALPLPGWMDAAVTASPGAVAVTLAALLGLGAVVGGLVVRLVPAKRSRPEPAGHDNSAAGPDPRIATLEAELAAARAAATRQQADADAGVQAFCKVLAPTLSALSDAAEQGRSAAAECAAQAESVHAAMQDAAEDASQTAATLAAIVAHADSLALSAQAIAAALGAVADALGPEQDPAHQPDGGADPGQSLVRLTGQVSTALGDLVGTLHTTAQSADTVAQRIAVARDAAAAGSEAAQAMARSSEVAGRSAVTVGLEFATFLDDLARAGNRRRFDRFPTDLGATIVVDGTAHTVRIVDVSRGGCAMDGDPGLETGTPIVIRLPGIEDIPGRVARRLGSITGLEFTSGDPLAGRLETLIVAQAEAA